MGSFRVILLRSKLIPKRNQSRLNRVKILSFTDRQFLKQSDQSLHCLSFKLGLHCLLFFLYLSDTHLIVQNPIFFGFLQQNLSYVMRKPVYAICQQQRHISACASTHMRRLIPAFVVRCLDSIIPLLAIGEISRP